MKKIFSLLAALLLLISLAGCNSKTDDTTKDDNNVNQTDKDTNTEKDETINPFTKYDSIDELKAELSYTLNSHDDLFTDMTEVTYSIITNSNGDKIVHIEGYKESKDTLTTITLRASDKFEGKIDLAGIYDEIEDTGIDEEGKHNYQGDKVSLVTWDEDNIHYSLYITEVPLSSIKWSFGAYKAPFLCAVGMSHIWSESLQGAPVTGEPHSDSQVLNSNV